VIDLREYPIPFYDADMEAEEGMPSKAKQLQELMIQSDVILIASPEYNRSIPAVLKNVLDWTSRKEGGGDSHEAYEGKIFAIMSASPGKRGGSGGLMHLRTIIEDIHGKVIANQVTVPNAYNAFDEQNQLKNPQLKMELRQLVQQALQEFISH
jgi:chromate reductase, NAD(P)H dehydrogenase (quinone)